MSAVGVTVAGLAWLASAAFALAGLAAHLARRTTARPGTVLSARFRSETTQDLVIGVARGRRPDAVIRLLLRRARLSEGQPVQVDVRSDGRVRLGLGLPSTSLSRPLLAYLTALQLAAIGILALRIPV